LATSTIYTNECFRALDKIYLSTLMSIAVLLLVLIGNAFRSCNRFFDIGYISLIRKYNFCSWRLNDLIQICVEFLNFYIRC
jgi:hypothetical protein